MRLRRRLSEHQGAYAYKIKVLTADRLNAGLGSTTVSALGVPCCPGSVQLGAGLEDT